VVFLQPRILGFFKPLEKAVDRGPKPPGVGGVPGEVVQFPGDGLEVLAAGGADFEEFVSGDNARYRSVRSHRPEEK
jgi:hypothetical protein